MRRTCNYPPPNTYNPDYRISKTADAKWGFGTGKRGGLTSGVSSAPGMQTYNIPSKMVEGSKWFMGMKLEGGGALSGAKGTKFVPGPG